MSRYGEAVVVVGVVVGAAVRGPVAAKGKREQSTVAAATDAKSASRMFNARAETITASPAFRDAFRRQRSIVPVDSFYEWEREGTVRQPYRVSRDDGLPLALAGLWAGWRDPETEEVRRTFTIVTTTPNEAMADLHDRMPVVLDEAVWDRWLIDGRAGPTVDEGELLAMLRPTDAVQLRPTPVNRYVNDVRRDGPELIEPLSAASITAATATAEGTLGL